MVLVQKRGGQRSILLIPVLILNLHTEYAFVFVLFSRFRIPTTYFTLECVGFDCRIVCLQFLNERVSLKYFFSILQLFCFHLMSSEIEITLIVKLQKKLFYTLFKSGNFQFYVGRNNVSVLVFSYICVMVDHKLLSSK